MPRYLNTCNVHQAKSHVTQNSSSENDKLYGKRSGVHIAWNNASASSLPDIPNFDFGSLQNHLPWNKDLNCSKNADKKHTSWYNNRDEENASLDITQEPAPLLVSAHDMTINNETSDRNVTLSNKLRWKNALKVYDELDVKSQGYIDIEEVVLRLKRLVEQTQSSPKLLRHAERLIYILEDLKPWVSSRGVIERDVAIHAIKAFIDDAGLSCHTYGPLRGSQRSAFIIPQKTSLRCYGLGASLFYRDAYVAKGILEQLLDDRKWRERGYVPQQEWNVSRKKLLNPEVKMSFDESEKHLKDFIIPLEEWGPVHAPLNVHALVSKIRKERRIAALRKENEEKMKKECPFKPKFSKESVSFKSRRKKPITKQKKLLKPSDGFTSVRQDDKKITKIKIKCPEDIEVLSAPEQSSTDATEHGTRRKLKRKGIREEKLPCRPTLIPEEFANYEDKQKDEKQSSQTHIWDDTLHFVLHVGEPPPQHIDPWERTLRSASLIDKVKDNKRISPEFDAYSQKKDKKQSTSVSRIKTTCQLSYTPKMAFQNNEDSTETNRETLTLPCRFERPYTIGCHLYPDLSSNDKLLRVGCVHSPCYLNPLHNNAIMKLQKRTKSLNPQPYGKIRPSDATPPKHTSYDDILLPQKSDDDNDKTFTLKKSHYKDFITGIKHPDRGSSEWVHQLRGGYIFFDSKSNALLDHQKKRNPRTLLGTPGPLRLP